MGGTMGAGNGRGFPVMVLDTGVQCACLCPRATEKAISWVWPVFSAVEHGVWQKAMSPT